jgi:uncharacterized membrane protein
MSSEVSIVTRLQGYITSSEVSIVTRLQGYIMSSEVNIVTRLQGYIMSSEVNIVTRLQGYIPDKGKTIFCSPKRPNWVCGPPSLLFSVKRPGR